MTELDQVIAKAYSSSGKTDDVNQVYLTILRAVLFVPTQKEKPTDGEPFSPLFAHVNEQYFMMVFDTLDRLQDWAGDQFSLMDYVELTGEDLITGINEQIYLGINIGKE